MSDESKLDAAIKVPPLCATHSYLLVQQCGFGPEDHWQVLVIATQATLFQLTTCDARVWKKLGGEAKGIEQLGCLACLKPDAFGEIVDAAQKAPSKDEAIGAIKRLGEERVAAEQKRGGTGP